MLEPGLRERMADWPRVAWLPEIALQPGWLSLTHKYFAEQHPIISRPRDVLVLIPWHRLGLRKMILGEI